MAFGLRFLQFPVAQPREILSNELLQNLYEAVEGMRIFYRFIDRLAARGITVGCNPPLNDQYCPSGTVTREQMSAFLMRALGEFNPPNPPFQRFADVPPTNIFYRFIERLAARGITVGCNPIGTLYCPETVASREQMAAFLVRAFGLE